MQLRRLDREFETDSSNLTASDALLLRQALQRRLWIK